MEQMLAKLFSSQPPPFELFEAVRTYMRRLLRIQQRDLGKCEASR